MLDLKTALIEHPDIGYCSLGDFRTYGTALCRISLREGRFFAVRLPEWLAKAITEETEMARMEGREEKAKEIRDVLMLPPPKIRGVVI